MQQTKLTSDIGANVIEQLEGEHHENTEQHNIQRRPFHRTFSQSLLPWHGLLKLCSIHHVDHIL
eukprot:scaffold41002_cov42-Attheya_sp.AAC.2